MVSFAKFAGYEKRENHFTNHTNEIASALDLTDFVPRPHLLERLANTTELLGLSGLRHFYREGALGVITEGAYADILIVDGNPLEDIRVLDIPKRICASL